jgi:hypothetical protein
MPVDRATEADILRCGYSLGYFDNGDIVKWADQQIVVSESVPTELLDLSMIRDAHPIDVMNLLRSLGSPDDSHLPSSKLGFIGLLNGEGRITTQDAIRRIYELAQDSGITQEQTLQIYRLDASYDLVLEGIDGAICTFEQELHDFLSPYSNLLVERYPNLISTKI